tara:strand:- start:49 stop:786 length:738 start_codon:yes stop_codon:yes gene_type:complete
MKKYKICAIIPARSGSKTVKDKNIIKVLGHPLLAYSISIAKKSNLIDKVIFTSDSNKYLRIASKYKPDILHKRSKKNSSDKSTDLDFLKEIMNFLNKNENYNPDLIVLLRGNCATRNLKNLNKAIRDFTKNFKKYSSLRSVTKMSETSYKTFIIQSNKLKSIISGNFNTENANKPKEMFPETYSGDGYLDIIKSKLIKKNKLHGSNVMPFFHDDICVDIDYPHDLAYTKFVLKYYKYFKPNNVSK